MCAWGSSGAYAMDTSSGELLFSASFPPAGGVVDSIGAGDTFLASMIFALAAGCTVLAALQFGCRVAGTKCGFSGFRFTEVSSLLDTLAV